MKMFDFFQSWIWIGLLFFILIVPLISIVAWSIRNGISPMPTSRRAKRILFSALPDLPSGIIYELGSGWGTLTFPLGHRYSHSIVIGFETSPIPYFISCMRNYFEKLPNISFRRQDFYAAPLKDATLLTCYLYPGAMERLRLKLEAELKPGAWVVSNTFAISGWKPEKILEVNDIYRSKIYLYRMEKPV